MGGPRESLCVARAEPQVCLTANNNRVVVSGLGGSGLGRALQQVRLLLEKN